MVERAGIPGLRHVVNAVAVIAALGAANTRLYIGVRLSLNWTDISREHYVRLQVRGKHRKSSRKNLGSGMFRSIAWRFRLFQRCRHS